MTFLESSIFILISSSPKSLSPTHEWSDWLVHGPVSLRLAASHHTVTHRYHHGQLARSRWACTVGLLTLVTALATPVPDASGEPTPEHPQERAKKIVDGLGGMSIGSIFPGPHGEQPQLEVLSQPPSPSPIPPPLGGLETETASITPVQAIGYSGYIVVVVVLFMYCKPRRKN